LVSDFEPNGLVLTGRVSQPGFQFPESTEGGIHCAGQVKARFAMTGKAIALEFVLPTALAIALGILLSIGAVYLADHYLGYLIDGLI
jgi:hypothetical protein